MARRYLASSVTTEDADRSARRWAASGMMALTGTPARPLGPPAGFVPGVDRLAARFSGLDLFLDPLTLLAERAALLGLSRHGSTSCGGGCRLLATSDGWLALSLVRDEDVGALPAWLGSGRPVPGATAAMWNHVAAAVADRPTAALVDQGVLLGLPVAAVGVAGDRPARPAVQRTPLGQAEGRGDAAGALVIDLTSLWAGPMCGALLAAAGAEVIKVESRSRPDGARRGPAEFFDLLNGPKQSMLLDFDDPADLAVLGQLLLQADVVLESSRPRALQQLAIRAEELVADGPPVWVSVTGFGREGDAAHRVAFGDDAAAAAGLVAFDGDAPQFCGDAVADPLSGLAAADACLGALEAGGRWLLDVSMVAVAAELAGPTLPVPEGVAAVAPQARPVTQRARELGADSAGLRARFGLRD